MAVHKFPAPTQTHVGLRNRQVLLAVYDRNDVRAVVVFSKAEADARKPVQ